MKTLKTLATGLAMVGLMSVTNVRASIVAIDGPIGDWNQEFNESGVGPFTAMEFVSVSGSLLQIPAFTGLATGWSQVAGDSSAALASGTAVTGMNFFVNFVDPQVPSVYDAYAFDGTTVVDNTKLTWDGANWSYASAPLPPFVVPVPEATTMLASALLLLPLGVSTLRILRRNRIS
jgi:hypothetical protein